MRAIQAILCVVCVVLSIRASVVRADELIYTYDCGVLPYDPSAGWVIYDPCVGPSCTQTLADGHFILDWPPNHADIVNYDHTITPAGTPPPPTLWIEWRFRSTLPLPPTSPGCDAWLDFVYDRIGDTVYLHGDAAVSFEGGQFIVGLELNQFHTYRFESLDGLNYRVAANGQVFITDVGGGTGGTRSRLQIGNLSGCPQGVTLGTHNEWDFIRYGTIGEGEAIVASDPPGGDLDAARYPNLDRFTVTFDQPNYVYIADITVEVMSAGTEARRHEGTEGPPPSGSRLGRPQPPLSRGEAVTAPALEAPIVIATRRQDNGPPETVEIVLDRTLAVGTTTRFTFNTGGTPNTVEYTVVQTGACCQIDGSCTDSNDADCAASGGAFTPGAFCTALVACCASSGSCTNLDPVCCTVSGGSSQGAGTVCEGDADGDARDALCGDSCPTDAAKTSPGGCGCGVSDVDTDGDTVPDCFDRCPGEDDRIDAGGNGIPDCLEPPIIPTASAWGLTVLTLFLLIAAKLYFTRRAVARPE